MGSPASIGDLIKSQMDKVPTNVRLFGEYVAGSKETITEQDFKPEELKAMSRAIAEQDEFNKAQEAEIASRLASLTKRSKEPFSSKKHQVWDDQEQKFKPKYTESEYNQAIQKEINRAQEQLSSYERTRGKTSVSYGKGGGGGAGASFLEAIEKSFNSPAYNVETSLGHFNAYKNKDGTVTIEDAYNFLGIGYDKKSTITLGQFLELLPSSLRSPESFGTLLARTFSPEKSRPVKIKLPSENNTKSTKHNRKSLIK